MKRCSLIILPSLYNLHCSNLRLYHISCKVFIIRGKSLGCLFCDMEEYLYIRLPVNIQGGDIPGISRKVKDFVLAGKVREIYVMSGKVKW